MRCQDERPTQGATGLSLVMQTWIRAISLGATGLRRSPGLNFKRRREEARLTVLRAHEEWKFENAGSFVVSESIEGKW